MILLTKKNDQKLKKMLKKLVSNQRKTIPEILKSNLPIEKKNVKKVKKVRRNER